MRCDSKDGAAGVLPATLHIMTESTEQTTKRINALEETTAWLKERVWYGTGNLHDRVHQLEDRSADRTFEIERLKEDMKSLKQIVGVEGYGGRNLINDLRDAVDSIDNLNNSFLKLKENLITAKDFQALLQIVEGLKQRDQAKITFTDKVMFVALTAVINFVALIVLTRVFGALP